MLRLLPGQRPLYLLIFLACATMLCIALYMQHQMELIPCALCITQRVFIIAVGLVALVAWIHHPKGWGNKAYAITGILLCAIGGAFSMRHLWLQSLPESMVPACGPSLGYLLDAFPLQEAISLLLKGDGNCAEEVWSLLGITIPGWTLIAFFGLTAGNLWQCFRPKVQSLEAQ